MDIYSICLFGFLFLVLCFQGLVDTVKIGTPYFYGDILQEIIDEAQPPMSVELFVMNKTLTGQGAADISYDNLIEIYKNLRRNKVQVMIAPHDDVIAIATEKLKMPYITTSLVGNGRDHIYRLLPHPTDIYNALHSVIDAYQWQRFAVIYEISIDKTILQNFITNTAIDVRMWQIAKGPLEHQLRRSLLEMRTLGIHDVVLLTRSKVTEALLNMAKRLGILALPYSWLIMELGFEDIGNEMLIDLETNVTMLSLVRSGEAYEESEEVNILANGQNSLRKSLLSDALSLTNVVETLLDSQTGKKDVPKAITEVTVEGKTGHVRFNEKGDRIDFSLIAYFYWNNTFTKIGEWHKGEDDTETELTIADTQIKSSKKSDFALTGKTARVVTILEEPWCMYRKDHEQYSGNDQYEGFSIDLIQEISEMLDFQIEVYLVPDGNFGSKLPNGEWNGIIGQVMSGNATMSMAPLSINADREAAVDFTKPFKTRAISILMKTPKSQSSYFQFMRPLSKEVWALILVSIVIMSCLLYGLEHYSLSCSSTFPKLNAHESCWFIIGSMLSGSTESTPVTVPGRIMTSAWWFFAMILISTYTANLAAFLTVKKINPPISSVNDLSGQTKIKFGTVLNSGVMSFFKQSKFDPFNEMWTVMSEIFPDTMVNSTADGLARVKEGNYAFLWDNTVTSYMAATDCDYTEIGPPFDPKGFGIALPTGATYKEALSLAILKLGDQGQIAYLENKWWGKSICDAGSGGGDDETAELELDNVAGIFIVLIGGAICSLLACLVDRLVARARIGDKTLNGMTKTAEISPKDSVLNTTV